jgi:hypothetical protein
MSVHQESRAPRLSLAWRSQGAQSVERFILGVRMDGVSFDSGGKKGGERRFNESGTGVLAPYEILLQSTLSNFV